MKAVRRASGVAHVLAQRAIGLESFDSIMTGYVCVLDVGCTDGEDCSEVLEAIVCAPKRKSTGPT